MPDEECVCNQCLHDLPYTDYYKTPADNYLARLFWKQLPIDKAASLLFYHPHAEYANIIYDLKYHSMPGIGSEMGKLIAHRFQQYNFFDSIDAIVPVPLSKGRQRQRGYNQSNEIAKGIASIVGLPILNNAVARRSFTTSQTHLRHFERQQNVAEAFCPVGNHLLDGKHLLLIDDVITTGATMIACGNALCTANDDLKISILSLAFTKD